MVPPIKQPILPFDDLGLVSSDDLRLASQISLSLAITWPKKIRTGAVKARNTSYKYQHNPIYRMYNPIYNQL